MKKSKGQEIYVLNKSGEILFYFNANKKSKEADQSKMLTASYLTGILKFAEVASGNIISAFEMGKLHIFLKIGQRLPLYFIFIVGKKVRISEKKADKLLSKIKTEFEGMYTKKEIKTWDGNLYTFKDFTEKAKKILKV